MAIVTIKITRTAQGSTVDVGLQSDPDATAREHEMDHAALVARLMGMTPEGLAEQGITVGRKAPARAPEDTERAREPEGQRERERVSRYGRGPIARYGGGTPTRYRDNPGFAAAPAALQGAPGAAASLGRTGASRSVEGAGVPTHLYRLFDRGEGTSPRYTLLHPARPDGVLPVSFPGSGRPAQTLDPSRWAQLVAARFAPLGRRVSLPELPPRLRAEVEAVVGPPAPPPARTPRRSLRGSAPGTIWGARRRR